MENKTKQIIEKLDEAISNLSKKNFTINFFVVDTKGNPNTSTRFIYETAKDLIDNGYQCAMLYQQETEINEKGVEAEVPFIGVGEWMGKDYSEIPHYSISSDNVKISASDFLIIPELFTNVMSQTKKLPCKRIALFQKLDHVTEFLPLGTSLSDYNIFDVITTTKTQAEEIKEVFSDLKYHVISPSIPDYFRESVEPKKLIVGVVIKDVQKLKKLVKQFYLRYPQYSWVSFKDLKNMPREEFANEFRDFAIVVWLDEETYFGYSAIEAIKSGCVVIGKIPTVIPDWMYNDDKTGISSNGIWYDNEKDVYRLLSHTIKLWLDDAIPEVITNEMVKLKDKYTFKQKQEELLTVFKSLSKDRINELQVVKNKFLENNK